MVEISGQNMEWSFYSSEARELSDHHRRILSSLGSYVRRQSGSKPVESESIARTSQLPGVAGCPIGFDVIRRHYRREISTIPMRQRGCSSLRKLPGWTQYRIDSYRQVDLEHCSRTQHTDISQTLSRFSQHFRHDVTTCDPYEWRLNPRLFQFLDLMWGPHDVDRFASMITCQVSHYNSRFIDPLTSGVNALSQHNWGELNNFVNCPFRLTDRVLDTTQDQRALATIIAPRWPSQPWFQRLTEMCVAPPINIPTHFTVSTH
jgi:hypothetical protein